MSISEIAAEKATIIALTANAKRKTAEAKRMQISASAKVK